MKNLTEEQRKTKKIKNEEKKKYLQSYNDYKEEAKRLEEQLEEVKMGKILPSMVGSDMPSSHNQKDLSDYIVQCDELIEKIIKKRKQAIERFTEVQQKIEKMKNENEKTVLTLRYLKKCKWTKIACEIGVEWAQVHRIHAKALEHFEMP